MASTFIEGFLFMVIPGFFLLSLLLMLSAKWFFKKDKLKEEKDLSKYSDTAGPSIIILVVSGIMNMFFSFYKVLIPIVIIFFIGALFNKYYIVKNKWKPFLVALIIGIIMSIFAVLWGAIGLVLFSFL